MNDDTNPNWGNFVYVYVSFVGVDSCYIYTFCFSIHFSVCSDILACLFLLKFIVHVILMILLVFNFLHQSVWFCTTVCKEEVSSVILVLIITPMLKCYWIKIHQSRFSTMCVTFPQNLTGNVLCQSCNMEKEL